MNPLTSIRHIGTIGAIALACACLASGPAAPAADKDKAAKKPAAKAPAKKAPAKKAPAKSPPKPVAKPSTAPLKALPAPESSATRAASDKTAASMDAAARLQAERRLAEAEQVFLRQLQDKLPVGIWDADRVVDEADGSTLLHHAVMQGWPDATEYLLRQGANPESRNILGKTPAILARELGHGEILKLVDDAVSKRARDRAAK